MKKYIRTTALVGVVGVALAMTACASGGSSSSSTSAAGDSGKSIYLVSSVGTGFQDAYNAAFLETVQAAGVEVTLLQDPFDVNQSVQNLDRAIAAKPSAVAIMSINDTALIPSLQRAKQAGVPVFYLDGRPVDDAVDLLTATMQADNVNLGKFAAENIVEGMEAQGKTDGKVIAITGTEATNTVQDRMDGFREVMADHPGIEIVAEEDGGWDQTKTAELAQQLFAKYESDGGIQGAYGMADNQAVGIVQAATQAGVPLGGTDGVVVTGSNCYAIGLDSIKAGDMWGTASQAPGLEATWAAGLVLDYVDGKDVPAENIYPSERITIDNVEQWTKDCTF